MNDFLEALEHTFCIQKNVITEQQAKMSTRYRIEQGSIELVVVGLLAALLVVLALPLFLDPPSTESAEVVNVEVDQ